MNKIQYTKWAWEKQMNTNDFISTLNDLNDQQTVVQKLFGFPSDAELLELIEDEINKPIMCHIVMAEDRKHDILTDEETEKLNKIPALLKQLDQ
jgi:hypothetical protein